MAHHRAWARSVVCCLLLETQSHADLPVPMPPENLLLTWGIDKVAYSKQLALEVEKNGYERKTKKTPIARAVNAKAAIDRERDLLEQTVGITTKLVMDKGTKVLRMLLSFTATSEGKQNSRPSCWPRSLDLHPRTERARTR